MRIFTKPSRKSKSAADQGTMLTRRALGGRIAGAAASLGLGAGPAAAEPVVPALDPALRDAVLRGFALAGHRGDPVMEAAVKSALTALAETDPEAAILGQIYQLLDVRPCAYYRADMPDAAADDLAALHAAIAACRPVAFGYTDQSGAETTRRVLPLALVHPPQGVKLLAWCETRAAFRQFFVREMTGLSPQPGDFAAERLALLQGLLAKEARGDVAFPSIL